MNLSFVLDDAATTEIYTLSLHDALPIFDLEDGRGGGFPLHRARLTSSAMAEKRSLDRKSTRLNSSHVSTSHAAFCSKNKNRKQATASGKEACTYLGPKSYLWTRFFRCFA